MPFINKPDSPSDLTNCMILFFRLWLSVQLSPIQKIFFWIDAFVADPAAFNPNDTKILLAIGVSTFFINGKLAVINGLRKIRKPLPWVLICYKFF